MNFQIRCWRHDFVSRRRTLLSFVSSILCRGLGYWRISVVGKSQPEIWPRSQLANTTTSDEGENSPCFAHSSHNDMVFIDISNRWSAKYQAYRGTDKSLARPGRKQARKHVRNAHDFNNIETRAFINFFFCKVRRRRKFTPFWQKH